MCCSILCVLVRLAIQQGVLDTEETRPLVTNSDITKADNSDLKENNKIHRPKQSSKYSNDTTAGAYN